MKTFLLTFLVAAITSSAFAQGTVNFANGAAGVNAPFYYVEPPTLASAVNYAGNTWYAMLFAGPAGSPASALTDSIVSGSPAVLGSPTPGYVLGGARTITGVGSGSQATLQIRMWSSSLYGSAYPAGAALDGNTPGFGVSAPIIITLGGGATPTPNMVGLGFSSITLIPEPSSMLLASIAFCVGALYRRRG